MRRNHRSHLVGAIAVAGMLLVAGCTAADQGASPTPPRAPTATSSASVSPTPAPTTPEPEPTPTVERNRETAKQFIIDYFEAYEEALRTGSAEPLDGLSTKDCSKCAYVVETVAEGEAAGHRWPEASSRTIPYASKVDATDAHLMRWEVDYKLAMGSQVGSDGALISTVPAERSVLYVSVAHDGTRWRMNGIAAGPVIEDE